MVRKFPPFRSERKKRSTSEGTPEFPNGISGKLRYHLTSNRNFRIFSPNGKHPGNPKNAISLMRLIFKMSSVTPDYVFNLILSFSACSQSFKNICVWELLGANVLNIDRCMTTICQFLDKYLV